MVACEQALRRLVGRYAGMQTAPRPAVDSLWHVWNLCGVLLNTVV